MSGLNMKPCLVYLYKTDRLTITALWSFFKDARTMKVDTTTESGQSGVQATITGYISAERRWI